MKIYKMYLKEAYGLQRLYCEEFEVLKETEDMLLCSGVEIKKENIDKVRNNSNTSCLSYKLMYSIYTFDRDKGKEKLLEYLSHKIDNLDKRVTELLQIKDNWITSLGVLNQEN